MDLNKYKELFVSGVRENLDSMADLAVSLEKEPNNPEAIGEIFRHAHSIKGMAATMGYKNMSSLSHKLESLLDRLRKGEAKFDRIVADVVLRTHSKLNEMLLAIEERSNDECPHTTVAEQIEALIAGRQIQETESSKSLEPDVKGPKDPLLKIKASYLDRLIDIVSEFSSLKWRIKALDVSESSPELVDELEQMEKLTRDLSEKILSMRMLPVTVLTAKMPRIIRDLSRTFGKDIEHEIGGESIELDKRIIEALESPIIHIIRNCVDHGIESPQERTATGKNKTGNVFFKVFRLQNRVVIELGDDGRGIDPSEISRKAVEKGIITQMDVDIMDEEKKLLLICAPGLSMQNTVSEISGRGVGMDIVKSTIESLGGNLAIYSGIGMGTTFRVDLPLTTVITKVFVVEADGIRYGIPTIDIEKVLEVSKSRLIREEGETFIESERNKSQRLHFNYLGSIFNREYKEKSDEVIKIMIVRSLRKYKLLAVDDLIGVEEVIVKPLSVILKYVKGVSAVTILPTGKPMFILNMEEVL